MSYLTIGVKGVTLENLESSLASKKVNDRIEVLKSLHSVYANAADYSDEFEYANEFLKKNNLEDDNEFFRIFDIDRYSTMVEFDGSDVTHAGVISIVKEIAIELSANLKTCCILLKDEMRVPLGLFENGNPIDLH